MVSDISRAYLHAPCRSPVYVERCHEDLDSDDAKDTCWLMLKFMYGTRPAAQD